MKRKRGLAKLSKSKRHKKQLEKRRSSGFTKSIQIVPNFQSIGQSEICTIKHTSLIFGCERKSVDNSAVLALYRTSMSVDFSLAIGFQGSHITISFIFGNERIHVCYSQLDNVGVVKGQNSVVVIARENVDDRKHFRLPRFVYKMMSEWVTGTKQLKKWILKYRERTEIILAQFCPSLPKEIFSLIWRFGISDSFLSAQVFCDFLQLYYDMMQDRCKNWLRILSIALHWFTQQADIAYLLEILNLSKFESAGQLLAKIAKSIPKNNCTEKKDN
jgi:hypothetical protein